MKPMKIDMIFFDGAWWVDLEQAARLLNVSPANLKRNFSTAFPEIETTVWHHVRLFRLDDLLPISSPST